MTLEQFPTEGVCVLNYQPGLGTDSEQTGCVKIRALLLHVYHRQAQPVCVSTHRQRTKTPLGLCPRHLHPTTTAS